MFPNIRRRNFEGLVVGVLWLKICSPVPLSGLLILLIEVTARSSPLRVQSLRIMSYFHFKIMGEICNKRSRYNNRLFTNKFFIFEALSNIFSSNLMGANAV